MRNKLLLVLALLLVFTASGIKADSFGSGFGSFSDASTLGQGKGNLLGGVGLADATTVFGIFSYGLSGHTDGRLKFGIIDADGADAEIMLGADFKYQFISKDSLNNGPFDMAFGAFFEYYNFGDSYNVGTTVVDYSITVWQLGGNFIGSYPLYLKNGNRLIPYGRLNVRLENFDSDFYDDSNLEVGINAGVRWEVTNMINFYGELQLDGNDGLFLGVDFNVM